MKLLKIIVILFTPGLLLLTYFYTPNLIKIKNIICQNQFGPCTAAIVEQLEKEEGKKFKDAKKNINNYLTDNISVADFSVDFMFPDTFIINLIERKAYYSIKKENYEKIALVDQKGFVIAHEGTSALPALWVQGDLPAIGSVISDDLLFASNIVYDMFSVYQIKEGAVKNNQLIFTFTDGKKVIFPMQGDREVLMGTLLAILNQLNSEGQGTKIEDINNFKVIDLRYNNPVIK